MPAATPSVLPRPDFHFPGSVGRTVLDSDKGQFPQPVKAPAGAPNVVIVLLDDVGFGCFQAMGGGLPSPNMDKFRQRALLFNRFHTTALCSPTRAALLTGRNHHSAAMGTITETATGYEGYTALLPKSCGTVAEVLRQNGYTTAMIGKNHNTPGWEASQAGPFDRWMTGMGFDYFYGFNSGDASQWEPVLFENHALVPRSSDPEYHATVDFTDRAISWVRRVKAADPRKPFFLYFATGAMHAPHHAPQEWIDKFRGQFDGGWDKYREETLARQKKLGVVPAETQLTPRPRQLPAWDSLEPDKRRLFARMMEVYAGFAAHTDYHVGRLFDSLAELPDAENTLIFYVVGDNGASAEGGLDGVVNEMSYFNFSPENWRDNLKVMDELGGPKYQNHFPAAWAHAMNTPFQWTKQTASHFGGVRNAMMVSWPARIKDAGGLRSQFHHVIDLAPTIYEAAGITAPRVLNGVEQKPIEGVSLAYAFDDAQAQGRRRTQYFEMFVNRGIYHDGYFASSVTRPAWESPAPNFNPDTATWELYDLEKDFSQANDLAAKLPEKLRQLQDLWWVEAAKYHVLPLDWTLARLNDELSGRPDPLVGLSQLEYFGTVAALPPQACPRIKNRSFTLTADVEIPATGGQGMLFTQGGYMAGFGWYLREGKLVFVHNATGTRYTVTSSEAVPTGKTQLRAEFHYDGGGLGKGGQVDLFAGGKKIGSGRIEKTAANVYSANDGMDVGLDTGSPVDFTYTPPFAFNGVLEKLTVELQ